MFLKELLIKNPSRIYVKEVTDILKPGMLIRIATNKELIADKKPRLTSAWTPSHEKTICFLEQSDALSDQKPRIFILTDELINQFRNYDTARLKYFGTVPDHDNWVMHLSEFILITEQVEKEVILNQLIRIDKSKGKLEIESILISKDYDTIRRLRDLNEGALKGTEKEATIEYRILQTKTRTLDIEIATTKEIRV